MMSASVTIVVALCLMLGTTSIGASSRDTPIKYAFYPVWVGLPRGSLSVDALPFRLLLSCDTPVFVNMDRSLEHSSQGQLQISQIEVWNAEDSNSPPVTIDNKTIELDEPRWKPVLVNYQEKLIITANLKIFAEKIAAIKPDGRVAVRLKARAFTLDCESKKFRMAQYLSSTKFIIVMKEGKLIDADILMESFDTESVGGLSPHGDFMKNTGFFF